FQGRFGSLPVVQDDKLVGMLTERDLLRALGSGPSQINIDIDPVKLSGYGLTLSQVETAIARENLTLPAGNIKNGLIDYTVRVPGEFEDPE
ncbi:CBS domain-containing protein, partial [Citrobacter sp. AAK_AS5]